MGKLLTVAVTTALVLIVLWMIDPAILLALLDLASAIVQGVRGWFTSGGVG